MVFIVGDIHGEITKLAKLIKNICSIDAVPSFIFIGDYVDKGENSKETLNYLVALNKLYNCKFLMGNHEYFWLKVNEEDQEAGEYLIKYGGIQTMESFSCKTILETKQKLIAAPYNLFFQELIPYVQYKDYIIVHSGISPLFYQTAMEFIPIKELLLNRYNFICNVSYYLNKYRVIFGHTGFCTPYYDGYKIGIDTAACFLERQPLTAFNADRDCFINSDNETFGLDSLNRLCCPNIVRNHPWRNNK